MVLPSWLCAHVHSMLTSSWACRTGEFWIACDFCDTWYDGKCVQVVVLLMLDALLGRPVFALLWHISARPPMHSPEVV